MLLSAQAGPARLPDDTHMGCQVWVQVWERVLLRALVLIALLWATAALAAPGRIVEQAFVIDPTGAMTWEAAQQQPQTLYTGALVRLLDSSVVWVRLRVAPEPGASGAAQGRLRLTPIWTQSLALYEPADPGHHGVQVRPLRVGPTGVTFSVHLLPLAGSAAPYDVWLRLDAAGPVYLKAEVLSVAQAEAQGVLDLMFQGILIGAHAVMVLVGAMVWLVDRSGIAHTLFTKQLVTVCLAAVNAELLWLPIWTGVSPLPEGIGLYGVEALRLLNMALSLWFFVRVFAYLRVPPGVLKAVQVPMLFVGACLVLLLAGELAMARTLYLGLIAAVPWVLLAGGTACLFEPVAASKGRLLALRLGFGVVVMLAWLASFPGGIHKTKTLTFIFLLAPVVGVSTLGVLLMVLWQRIKADRQRVAEQKQAAALNEQALGLERVERQRQQEFMAMLTHELKAPLSTLGMVLGSATPSAMMHRHASLALASMEQIIDHCAQSAELEATQTGPSPLLCSLAVAFELRCAAQREAQRIVIAPADALPTVMADPRLLAVIFNNLLDNALKYSPPGSTVRAALVREQTPQGMVQRLSVSNHALAGPLPDAGRLFEKYYRGEAVQRISGSGMGLHLSRLLARRMGGDLLFAEQGGYITLSLLLPEAAPA